MAVTLPPTGEACRYVVGRALLPRRRPGIVVAAVPLSILSIFYISLREGATGFLADLAIDELTLPDDAPPSVVPLLMPQLEDTLTNDGSPPGLAGLVKGLIKNYKLDESLQQGAMYIERPGDRNAAASAGMEALEYLAQTAEYFPVQIDDRYEGSGAPRSRLRRNAARGN